MNRTTVKKIVGAIGAGLTALAVWMTLHQSELVALAGPKYAPYITGATATLAGISSLLGKHPFASPSVSDALKDGHLALEVQKAELTQSATTGG